MATSNNVGHDSHAHDLEKDHHGRGLNNNHTASDGGGANLGRQVSIQLSAEQYERLFFQPGGPARGDAAKRYGNPTLLGVIGFLLCLQPSSMMFMQWHMADATSVPIMVGPYYSLGTLCMTLAAIGEWILGNTFPTVVYASFASFWLSFAILNDPMHNIVSAFADGAATPSYNAGIALYAVAWACVCLVYFVAGLRTNVAFEVIFMALVFVFSFLASAYWHIAAGNVATAMTHIKVAGAFSFVTCLSGWYLAVVLACASTGVPLALPVGDLSNFLTRKTAT